MSPSVITQKQANCHGTVSTLKAELKNKKINQSIKVEDAFSAFTCTKTLKHIHHALKKKNHVHAYDVSITI